MKFRLNINNFFPFFIFIFFVLFIFLTNPGTTSALTCACYDPDIGSSIGPLYEVTSSCDEAVACNSSCEHNCALCTNSGGRVDCGIGALPPPPAGNPGGGGGGPGSGGSSGGASCPASEFTIEGVVATLSCHLNRIIPFLVLTATALFLLGILMYMTAGGDENKTANARRMILFGIIGFAVMISVWGLVYILYNAVFNTFTIPNIPGDNVVKPL